MKHRFRETDIEVIHGDLTEQTTEAIVNPTNGSLAGTHGLDAWIHRKGGGELQAACQALKHPTDEYAAGWAGPTPAGNLATQWVIHTVAPVWENGSKGEILRLERCYSNALQCAREQKIRSISFPSIATGRNGFPLDWAAYVAFNTINRAIAAHPEAMDRIQIVVLEAPEYEAVCKIGEEIVRTMMG